MPAAETLPEMLNDPEEARRPNCEPNKWDGGKGQLVTLLPSPSRPCQECYWSPPPCYMLPYLAARSLTAVTREVGATLCETLSFLGHLLYLGSSLGHRASRPADPICPDLNQLHLQTWSMTQRVWGVILEAANNDILLDMLHWSFVVYL